MISKELLSEVLSEDVARVYEFTEEDVFVPKEHITAAIYNKQTDTTEYPIISIYELQYKCKQWAYKLEEYVIESGLANGDAFARVFDRLACTDSSPIFELTADTEVEAVIKACEWILINSYR